MVEDAFSDTRGWGVARDACDRGDNGLSPFAVRVLLRGDCRNK